MMKGKSAVMNGGIFGADKEGDAAGAGAGLFCPAPAQGASLTKYPSKRALFIEQATPEHAALVAENLRPEDLREWEVLSARSSSPEKTPLAGMLWGLENGEAWYACGGKGEPVGIFGCARHRGFGAPWLMSTPAIARYGLSAVRVGRRMVARWREEFPVLLNAADAENEAALAYIRRVGFTSGGVQHGCVIFGMRGHKGVNHV